MPVSTALHLVPEPDDEPTPPPTATAWEQAPTAGPVVDLTKYDEPEADELDDAGETPDDVDEHDEDQEPAPRALAMPDLRPYASLSWVPLVIRAGAEANRRRRKRARAARAEARAAGEQPRRQLRTVAIDVVAGTVGMLRYGAAWLGGEGGPDSIPVKGRLALAALTAYFYYRSVGTWPEHSIAALIAVWLAGALGLRHRQRAETSKKDAKKKPAKSVEKRPGPPPAEAGQPTPAQTPAQTLAEDPEQTPAEAPQEDPLTALIRAEIGAENGVHLADLRPAMRAAFPTLREAPDEALRELLTEAGWDPSKKFRARGRAGRQGVHRKQLPPLPSPETGPDHSPQPALRAETQVRRGAETSGEQPGEERRGDSERDFDIVPDPERGPAAWRIVHHGKDRSQ